MGNKILNGFIFLSASAAIYTRLAGMDYLFGFLKPFTTVLIILVPILFAKKPFRRCDYLILAGLIFSLFGDTFLLWESKFVEGLGSFLVAHILFTIAFVQIGGFKKYWLVLLGLLAIGVTYFVFISSSLGDLMIPVLIYFLVIIMMCWQGISLYVWKKEQVFLMIAIAVVLFMFSDSMIALDKFIVPFELSPLMILSTYWLSIGLIANSTCLLERTDLLNLSQAASEAKFSKSNI